MAACSINRKVVSSGGPIARRVPCRSSIPSAPAIPSLLRWFWDCSKRWTWRKSTVLPMKSRATSARNLERLRRCRKSLPRISGLHAHVRHAEICNDRLRPRPHHGSGAQALGYCPTAGLARRWPPLADRPVDHPRPMGSLVGSSSRRIADHSAPRPDLRIAWPGPLRRLRWQDWQHPLYVVILYAVIVVVDGFLLQPYIMRRVARVPMWASILVPLVLGFVIPFWGFLLAPPLLAVVYAYKARRAGNS